MFLVKESKIQGKGCFAGVDIPSGTIIDTNVILVERNDSLADPTYKFPWSKEHLCIVIHPFTFCNSSINSNLKILELDKDKLIKRFIFTNDVKQDEEILLCYMKDHLTIHRSNYKKANRIIQR